MLGLARVSLHYKPFGHSRPPFDKKRPPFIQWIFVLQMKCTRQEEKWVLAFPFSASTLTFFQHNWPQYQDHHLGGWHLQLVTIQKMIYVGDWSHLLHLQFVTNCLWMDIKIVLSWLISHLTIVNGLLFNCIRIVYTRNTFRNAVWSRHQWFFRYKKPIYKCILIRKDYS